MRENFKKLVSVIVTTYKSATTVTETLDSIKIQSYTDIELIITDDCSPDDTVPIVEKWLTENKHYFKNTQLITTEQNSGISGNLNRGLKFVNGVWIKYIAGDDILLPDCIAVNVLFAEKNCSDITFSKMIFFSNGNILHRGKVTLEQKIFFKKNQIAKTKSYIRNPAFLNIPTIFLRTDMIKKLNGFTEDFKLLEDQPLIIKALLNGYDIHFFNQETVKYRIHSGSITGTGSLNFLNDLYNCYIIYRKPYLKNNNLIDIIFKGYIEIDFYFKLKGLLRSKFYRVFNRLAVVIRVLS